MLTDQTPDQIMIDLRKRLAEVKGQWVKLAMATGVPRDTIVKISDGRTNNPRLETLVPLVRALEHHQNTGNFYGRRQHRTAGGKPQSVAKTMEPTSAGV